MFAMNAFQFRKLASFNDFIFQPSGNLAPSEPPKVWRSKSLDPAEHMTGHGLIEDPEVVSQWAERALKVDDELLFDS